MSVSKNLLMDIAPAGATTGLFKFVTMTSDGTVDPAGAGAPVYGVSYAFEKDGTAGDLITMVVAGIAKVTAGGTVATGAIVASDANGDAVAAAAGDVAVGIARKGGGDGDVIEVLITHPFNAAT